MYACVCAVVIDGLRSHGSQEEEALAVEACLVLEHLSADKQGSSRLASLGACEGGMQLLSLLMFFVVVVVVVVVVVAAAAAVGGGVVAGLLLR